MRFLHTADWHVGKALQGRSRNDEHKAVLAEITELARAEQVDLILVAGDLFDGASPSADAETIVYEALLAMKDVAPVVVIPGNHDSERRLAAVAPLFDIAGVTVRSSVREPGCLEITTAAGEKARIATLPWLSQRFIIKADQLMSQDADQLSGHFEERMRRIVARLTSSFDDDSVNILLGHLTIGNAQHGGGERTAHTILDYCVPATIFPSTAHYVALGHIHKMQKMPGPCPIYYAGAPLHLDFSDTEDDRCTLVVDAHPGIPAEVRPIPLTSGTRLRTITGGLADLKALEGTTGDDYLRIRVREMARVGLGDEVRELFPRAVKVIVEAPEGTNEPRRDRDPSSSASDLFRDYLTSKDIEDPGLVRLFDSLYEEMYAADPA